MQNTILIVDDDQEICESLKSKFTRDGYVVWVANSGQQALDLLAQRTPDVLLLDMLLPDMLGLEVCRFVRERCGEAVGIIIITGEFPDDVDQVAGLENGANDYILKPFSTAVLRAKVRGLLRHLRIEGHSGMSDEGGSDLKRGWIVIDSRLRIHFERHEVLVEGKPVDLSPMEFKLLKCLIEHAGIPVTRTDLAEKVWEYKDGIGDAPINTCVSRLRNCIEPDRERPQYILSVHTVGYKFKDF